MLTMFFRESHQHKVRCRDVTRTFLVLNFFKVTATLNIFNKRIRVEFEEKEKI